MKHGAALGESIDHSPFEVAWPTIEEPTTDLFHYTSHASLIKIVETKKLFATGIRYLNDATEFRYTEELLVGLINERTQSLDERVRAVVNWIAKNLFSENEIRARAYVVCFTAEKDLLSQWRAYCPPGGGYAIGFSPPSLHSAAISQGFELLPCIYDLELQDSILNQLIDRLSDWLLGADELDLERANQGLTTRTVSLLVMEAWSKLLNTVVQVAPQFKHPAFREEREWRAVLRYSDLFHSEASWRAGRNVAIPYRRFEIPKIEDHWTISEVVIGPTPSPDLSHDSVVSLVKSNEIKCTKFSPSHVPYREW